MTSAQRHRAEDAWRAESYYRRSAFWRALRESLVDRYAARGGESPAQIVILREQVRDGLHAERAVKEALRTKGIPSPVRWIALPTSTQSLVLRRIRDIASDVRRGASRETAAIAGSILQSWLTNGDNVSDEENKVEADEDPSLHILVALRARQLTDHHGEFASPHEMYAVIFEEVCEFFDEVRRQDHERCNARLMRELIDIAAAALRAANQIARETGCGAEVLNAD